jgi:hypothetical protein
MIDPLDVHSLTDFQRDARSHIRRLQKSGRPALLTVNGKAALVVQDAATYRKMLLLADKAREMMAVREAIDQMKTDRGRPLSEVAREFRKSRAGSARSARKKSA